MSSGVVADDNDVAAHVRAATALVHLVIGLADGELALGIPERATRERLAIAAIDHLGLAVAVFAPGSREPRLANAAWRDTFAAEPPAMLLARVAEVAQGNRSEPLVLVHGAAHHEAHLETLRGSLGAPAGAIVICANVTEQALARNLGGSIDALIWSGPAGGAADHANRAWANYAGGLSDWQSAIHTEDLQLCSDAFELGAGDEIEARLRRLDGTFRWHRVRFVAFRNEGRWYGVAIDIHDARERQELLADARTARAEAEQANRLKDQFLATVSHELRAPVTTMLLWEKVLREQIDGAARAQALDAIRQSARIQSRLVGDLLDVSRAISGKLYVDLHPLSLGDVISAALDAALPAALAREITLSHKGKRPGTVVGDIARLQQVLDNVLANAIKFTDPGGKVIVHTHTHRREIVIAIEDTGCGIPEHLIERIFEPFHQANDMLMRRQGGLGLGLAIARQLVQLHGGTLQASSPGPGQGSTFTIRLPASNRRRSRTPSPNEMPASLAGRRVLVIDDDSRVCEALTLLLRRAGAVVDTADSASQGRARFAAAPPELIICDLAMPDEDGYTFIRALRASGSVIPAIALTAHAMEADVARALEAGFTLHLAKPVHFERLVTSIGALIEPSSNAVT